jgi:hypothetical protein
MPSIRAALLLTFVFAALAPASGQGRDSVTVVTVTPSDPLHRGVPTEIAVVVDVVLATMDSAQLAAGFNTGDAKRYRMGADAALHRGRQRITLRASVVPVDWSAQGSKFGYIVNIRPLGPMPADGRGRGISSVRGQFEVVP